MTSEKEWEEWNLILGRDPVVWEVLTHIVERHLFRESTPPPSTEGELPNKASAPLGGQ